MSEPSPPVFCDLNELARIAALEAESAARLEQMQADRKQALVWRDEVDALRTAIERACEGYPDGPAEPTCVQILREALSVNSASRDRHAAEVDALRKDAERFRWLRDRAIWMDPPAANGDMVWCVKGPSAIDCHPCDGEELAAAIDAKSAASMGRTMAIDRAAARGAVFSRLTVLSLIDGPGRTRVSARCECGAERICRADHLLSGRSKSCGCLSREAVSARQSTHRLSKSREYKIWGGMVQRCTNPKVPHFERHGGRGIRVCDRWREFENFLADMGTRPSPRHSIERTNNDGNYEPGNCVWATAAQQAMNKTTTRLVTINGETNPLSEWRTRIGLSSSAFHSRIKLGWTVERALTVPPRGK